MAPARPRLGSCDDCLTRELRTLPDDTVVTIGQSDDTTIDYSGRAAACCRSARIEIGSLPGGVGSIRASSLVLGSRS